MSNTDTITQKAPANGNALFRAVQKVDVYDPNTGQHHTELKEIEVGKGVNGGRSGKSNRHRTEPTIRCGTKQVLRTAVKTVRENGMVNVDAVEIPSKIVKTRGWRREAPMRAAGVPAMA
jgi:hypothetical protein